MKEPKFPKPYGVSPTRAEAVKIRAWLKRYDVWCRSKRKSKGRHARTKGHSFEREIAAELRSVFPDARRHLEYQDGEANGVDIANTGDYRIQCKRNIGYAPISALNEIQYAPELGEIPVLVTQADKCDALVVLPFAEFKRLLEIMAYAERNRHPKAGCI